MVLVSCPTCGKRFDPQQCRTMPFCCDRCRKIDLNRWLSEEIALPYREVGDGDRSDAPDDPELN